MYGIVQVSVSSTSKCKSFFSVVLSLLLSSFMAPLVKNKQQKTRAMVMVVVAVIFFFQFGFSIWFFFSKDSLLEKSSVLPVWQKPHAT